MLEIVYKHRSSECSDFPNICFLLNVQLDKKYVSLMNIVVLKSNSRFLFEKLFFSSISIRSLLNYLRYCWPVFRDICTHTLFLFWCCSTLIWNVSLVFCCYHDLDSHTCCTRRWTLMSTVSKHQVPRVYIDQFVEPQEIFYELNIKIELSLADQNTTTMTYRT